MRPCGRAVGDEALMDHFRQIGVYDVSGLIAAVEAYAERFADETWRQDYPGSAHRNSETVYLRMPPIIDAHSLFNSMDVVDLPLMQDVALSEACHAIAGMAGKPLARAMITKLRSGGVVTPHIDQGAYAEATERYHLPIVTNPDVLMRSGGEMVHMPVGTVWWFDKHAIHAVINGGADRTHLIVDVLK